MGGQKKGCQPLVGYPSEDSERGSHRGKGRSSSERDTQDRKMFVFDRPWGCAGAAYRCCCTGPCAAARDRRANLDTPARIMSRASAPREVLMELIWDPAARTKSSILRSS